MQRPTDIQTERLILRAILPEEIEWLLAGDAQQLEMANGFAYPADDPNRAPTLENGTPCCYHTRLIAAASSSIRF